MIRETYCMYSAILYGYSQCRMNNALLYFQLRFSCSHILIFVVLESGLKQLGI